MAFFSSPGQPLGIQFNVATGNFNWKKIRESIRVFETSMSDAGCQMLRMVGRSSAINQVLKIETNLFYLRSTLQPISNHLIKPDTPVSRFPRWHFVAGTPASLLRLALISSTAGSQRTVGEGQSQELSVCRIHMRLGCDSLPL